jgi:hypothetical protein
MRFASPVYLLLLAPIARWSGRLRVRTAAVYSRTHVLPHLPGTGRPSSTCYRAEQPSDLMVLALAATARLVYERLSREWTSCCAWTSRKPWPLKLQAQPEHSGQAAAEEFIAKRPEIASAW